MNPLAKLDQLSLEPAAKTEVVALIQSLMEQSERDAKVIKIAALTHELAYYKHIRFSTKSEAQAPLQRDVFEETWNTDISAIEAEVEQLRDESPCSTVARLKRQRAGRQPIPPHLPRIEHRHEPAKFFVHRHIRPQYACRACESDTAAPIPPAVIDGAWPVSAC